MNRGVHSVTVHGHIRGGSMKVPGTKTIIVTGLAVLGVVLSGMGEERNERAMAVEKEQLFEFVISLGEKHAFTPEALASLTGLSLTDDPFTNEHFTVHRSRGDAGREHPFIREAELRSPVERGNPGGLIILDLHSTSHITRKDVVERFGEAAELTIPYPEQPAEDPIGLVYRFDWGKLSFGCSRDEPHSVISVVLDAYERGAPKE